MKKSNFVFIFLLIIAAGAYLIYANRASFSQEAMSNSEDALPTFAPNENMQESNISSKYVTYTPEVLSASSFDKRVLFFYANWCPTCRPADASFREGASLIPDDTLVVRVNYNDDQTDESEKKLAQKYGVTYQHTYVQIDKEGNEVNKWNGGSLDELIKNIK